ncbi:flagellar hook-associated protein 1 [Candidatus Photodesmus katoptron]|uniref:Flagellar hook-associated protein 1 n=1 Tax=Candidatus Photodesmus katoptron Akat1 TaxID=1236703 RepID=S3DLC7_9GAMM|nr:flagellar hook-associated protein FlgK [Candidatus Photodesmus katoptron]EPE37959.1 flagellar hook-associated protein FlgK [Candidatus Photodesmus katoptron Akat1]KEY90254.1 flagellar hook-associated protein 1 [Candidatus Photodesmus katoptron]
MTSDLLHLGIRGVLTAQKQLNTTSHNIANANTEGYSRQSLIQRSEPSHQYAKVAYGMGVHVEKVRRSWDQFAIHEFNLSTTRFSFYQGIKEHLDLLARTLSSMTSQQIPKNFHEWFDSVKILSDSPNDIGIRKIVLAKAAIVSNGFNDFDERIKNQASVIDEKLNLSIEHINQLAYELCKLQRLMIRIPKNNDLMDRHKQLISELSQYTKVIVTPRKDSKSYNIHIGSGHTLVSGVEASQLKIIGGYPDIRQRRLAIIEGENIKAIIPKDISGSIGALFDIRDKYIPKILDEVGRMSVSFSYEVNKLQSQSLDWFGNIGGLLFTDVNSEDIARSRVFKSTDSMAELAVFIEDTSKLKSGEYSLRYTGDSYVVNDSMGKKFSIEINNGSLIFDGMRIEVRNNLNIGEKVLIRPTRNGSEKIKMVANDPKEIAAQNYEVSSILAQGKDRLKIIQVGGLREFEVSITSDGDQFIVTNSKGEILQESHPYPPPGLITIEGTTFELTGGAFPNDKFIVNLMFAEGNNSNLHKIQELQTEKILDNKESTLLDSYYNLNTDIALEMSFASRLTETSRLEKNIANERIASVSGVNLDEEAANMMSFQQSYMASSRIIQVANDIFDAILSLR